MKKPEPVPTAIRCSLCGLSWEKHPEKATAEDCVGLLKAELARRPYSYPWHGYPYMPPPPWPNYPQPYIGTPAPWQSVTITSAVNA